MLSDECDMVLPSKRIRLSVALTFSPLPSSLKQETLFDGIKQDIKISLSKCIH